ncbi:DDHD domain-containing protein [Mrakia frigida]|uniref:DDHD family phospholipase n=1 Tax=Mrakia frigida TaxID=29902 RepID=UPI003FCBFF34
MEVDDSSPPPLEVRWLHLGTPYLDLSGVPVSAPAQSYAAFSKSESSQMETIFLSLSEEDQLETRTKNPSLEDLAKEKASKDKIEAAKAKSKKSGNVKGRAELEREEEAQEADELHAREEERKREVEMELKKSEKAEEIEKEEKKVGVPVAKDGLFEVDVKEMKLYPIFWENRGPNIPVRRGRWFFDERRPCPEDMCDELEEGYLKIKPWVSSYADELQASLLNGKQAEAKLRFELVKSKEAAGGSTVIYQDAVTARVVSESMTSRLSSTLWTALRAGGSYSAGTHVYRGYHAALVAFHPPNAVPGGSSSQPSTPTSRPLSLVGSTTSARPSFSSGTGTGTGTNGARPSLDEFRKSVHDVGKELKDGGREIVEKGLDGLAEVGERLGGALEGEGQDGDNPVEGVEMPNVQDNGEDEEPEAAEVTDLILIVHGIGQQLATTHEGFNFVYAANILRKEAQKQALSPALASIMRDRQVQFLPIQWRASLKLVHNAAEAQEDLDHDLHNEFTLDDVTLKNNIQYVRELTNAVLIDIPLFMSSHKQSMVEAVSMECNRTYRKWCLRHPQFAQTGRVHIIAHSLGSALVADILSDQTTTFPKLPSLPKQVLYETRDRFIFDTHSLFLVGSPLALFMHLRQAQLVPRRGRERTKNSPPDEALDRAGRFGCLAVDSIYNIFMPSDPIAYLLNATVDSKLAKHKTPLAISQVTAGVMASLSESVGRGVGTLSKIFDGIPNPFGAAASPSKRPQTIRLPSGLELSGPAGSERLRGSVGERRFSALNPHGNLDFCLNSAGSISEYVDMLTSHGDYWADKSFAAFILAEIFASKEDLVRTGMGAPSSQGEDMIGSL